MMLEQNLPEYTTIEPNEEIDTLKLFQLFDTALFSEGGKLAVVAITSSAQGAVETEGWNFGQGKSHLAAHLSREIIHRAYNPPDYCLTKFNGSPDLIKWSSQKTGEFTRLDAEEKVKTIAGYPLTDVAKCLRTGRVLTNPVWWQDDWQIPAGKHMSHDKGIQQLAGILSSARPYVRIFVTTQPDLGMIAKCMRDLAMFELKVPERGQVEIQQLKSFTDFSNPLFPVKKMVPLRKGVLDVTDFPKLSPDMGVWYNKWRDENFNAMFEKWVTDYLEGTEGTQKLPFTRRQIYEAFRGAGIKGDDSKFNQFCQNLETIMTQREYDEEDD